jgi:hypothetical protein
MGARARAQLDRDASIRDRDASDPWWDGRQVAIRPDVPGPALDPGDLVLIKSDTERIEAQTGISRFVDETKSKSPQDLWPKWLWEADDGIVSDPYDDASNEDALPE